jgi:beta-glucosidase
VAQLYVGDPSSKEKRPAKELKAFQKVRLDPGEKKIVTFNLDLRALSYWDESAHGWRADAGPFQVFVGDSSQDTPLTANFSYQPR